jgi:hypothetical protein
MNQVIKITRLGERNFDVSCGGKHWAFTSHADVMKFASDAQSKSGGPQKIAIEDKTKDWRKDSWPSPQTRGLIKR